MTLEELYYISQIAAVFAILASLAAVYWQVRQTNQIARADLTHSVWLQGGQMALSLYDTPEKADLMQRALYGTGPASDAEKLRVGMALSIGFGVPEAAFTLRKRGLVESTAYNGLEGGLRRYLRSPLGRQWLADHRVGKDPEFIALLDRIVAGIDAEQAAKTGSEAKQS